MNDIPVKCETCGGTGKVPNDNAGNCDPKYITCSECGGTGTVLIKGSD